MRTLILKSLLMNMLIACTNCAVNTQINQDQNCNRPDSYCYNGPKFDQNNQIKTCSSNGILLSFDNAPSSYTSSILDILKENNVKAVFFLKGINILQYPTLVQRMINEGHQIGCQSFDLQILTEITSNKFEDNLIAFENALATVNINRNFRKYFRAPRGYLTEDLVPILEKYNYIPVQWTFRSGDVFASNSEDVITTLQNHLEGPSINSQKLSVIVQFDSENSITGQYMSHIINYLNTVCSRGTRFITMNQCINSNMNRKLLSI